jgi:hypothetical protein
LSASIGAQLPTAQTAVATVSPIFQMAQRCFVLQRGIGYEIQVSLCFLIVKGRMKIFSHLQKRSARDSISWMDAIFIFSDETLSKQTMQDTSNFQINQNRRNDKKILIISRTLYIFCPC